MPLVSFNRVQRVLFSHPSFSSHHGPFKRLSVALSAGTVGSGSNDPTFMVEILQNVHEASTLLSNQMIFRNANVFQSDHRRRVRRIKLRLHPTNRNARQLSRNQEQRDASSSGAIASANSSREKVGSETKSKTKQEKVGEKDETWLLL
jgi:hypothetical protein